MPLSVEIKINGQPISTYHIGRSTQLEGKDEIYRYQVTDDADYIDHSNIAGERVRQVTHINFDQKNDVWFLHKYSDGAETCVRKALEALGY